MNSGLLALQVEVFRRLRRTPWSVYDAPGMRIVFVVIVALFALPAAAVEMKALQASARGFPQMRDLAGAPIADGNLAQWVEGGLLHLKLVFEYGDGRHTEETAVLRQEPEVAQVSWLYVDRRGETVLRRFEVNFTTGHATAQKTGDRGGTWDEKMDIEPGHTFAGLGFVIALVNLRDRLVAAEKIQLKAVAFTPKPRGATVTLSREASELLHMGGRSLESDRFVIHPEVPFIAKLFIKVPDQRLWLYKTPPAGFMRGELPAAETSDPLMRIDVLPSAPSAAAAAAAAKSSAPR